MPRSVNIDTCPCLTPGDVLLVAFASAPESQAHAVGGGGTEEHAVFWRSTDGGLSYSPREYRPDCPGPLGAFKQPSRFP